MYIADSITSPISATGDVMLTSNDGIAVICAWPLSGQYGPGARMLYYFLIVMCIFGAHSEWMRGACLAAALLFPAVAAIHALVISSLSKTAGAVDLDIFGTFQLCAIGVLTVPITIRYSKTYFETKGRNVVFMWTALNLAGLLSLIVAFYRADPKPCMDNSGGPVSLQLFQQNNAVCAGTCSGRRTLIREDPSNPSQWILAPHVGMTIRTATLFCTACCVPSILSLISVWTKVMRLTWFKRWRTNDEGDGAGDPELGVADDASSQSLTHEEYMKERENAKRYMEIRIKFILGLVERIVFTACILAIVILGERNFWSHEMREGVEPITSIGQWGPIAGAALAVIGSLWTSGTETIHKDEFETEPSEDVPLDTVSREAGPSTDGTAPINGQGHRGRVNKGLFKVLEIWGTPGAERFADDVHTKKYRDYPLIPGEKERNEHLDIKQRRHQERQASRGSSLTPRRGSDASTGPPSLDGGGGSIRTSGGSSDNITPFASRVVASGSGSIITPPPPAHAPPGHHLTVPGRRNTSPRETAVTPSTRRRAITRSESSDIPIIVVEEALDTDSDTSSAQCSPARALHRTFTL